MKCVPPCGSLWGAIQTNYWVGLFRADDAAVEPDESSPPLQELKKRPIGVISERGHAPMTPENWQVVEAISTAVSVLFMSGFAAIWTWYRP
jgi:hypothetical protein